MFAALCVCIKSFPLFLSKQTHFDTAQSGVAESLFMELKHIVEGSHGIFNSARWIHRRWLCKGKGASKCTSRRSPSGVGGCVNEDIFIREE